jgi:hypothetical protein
MGAIVACVQHLAFDCEVALRHVKILSVCIPMGWITNPTVRTSAVKRPIA